MQRHKSTNESEPPRKFEKEKDFEPAPAHGGGYEDDEDFEPSGRGDSESGQGNSDDARSGKAGQH